MSRLELSHLVEVPDAGVGSSPTICWVLGAHQSAPRRNGLDQLQMGPQEPRSFGQLPGVGSGEPRHAPRELARPQRRGPSWEPASGRP
eukprot:3535258-Alexandrium_andersonii.AAC.1